MTYRGDGGADRAAAKRPGWVSRRYGAWQALFNAAAALVVAAVALVPGARAGEPPVIVAFGDSLSAGYGLAEADSFPAQLERYLAARGVRAKVTNAGVSGDTTAGGLARLEWTLAAAPDLVVVELGANDMLRGIEPAVTRANLDAILSRLGARGVPVLLAGMKASPNLGRRYVHQFDAIYPELAAAHGVTLYPFFLDGVAADPALNQTDGLHPNARGVARIVAGIAPYVIRLLER